ncbi:unnamed protein product [Rhizoctonia solani]|uniref:Uncharacterized protein n=1 Tax=Rhizoctonia solani TaxID=456999 RepID=A0A8H3HE17_9AGAM|nr:unnamed protein product [Rhizoctonia solani]
MPLRTYACAPFHPARDRQTLGSRFPLVISSQPTPQLGMIIGPPLESCLEKDLLQDAQRLRGGGLCGCCGGGNAQRRSPLEPQPDLPEIETTRTEQATPKAASKEQAPRSPRPPPPNQTSQTEPSEKTPSATKPTGATLAAPNRSNRTLSSPAAPPQPVSQTSEQSRTRRQTLPSKLFANQPTLPSSSSPIPEGTIDYGGGIMRSPAFPPSVHVAGGSRKVAGGPLLITAPFMKD